MALSYELVERRDGLYDLEAVAVVDRSATVCLPPIDVRDGTLDRVAGRVGYPAGAAGKLIRNAAEVLADRRHNRPIQVRGLLDPDQQEAAYYAHAAAARGHYTRPGRVEFSRHRGEIISVR